MSVGEALRDEFFAAADEPARAALLAAVAAVDAPSTTALRGLPVSHFPTARCKQLRFVDAARLDAAVRPLFARPLPALPELAAVFVDPEALAYHDFENIVGLDHLFAGLADGARLGERAGLDGGVTRLLLKPSPALAEALARLDGLGLYAPPFAVTRGGRRFIFHAAGLAEALTAGLRRALPAAQLRGFVHVNPVFRCNRFDPGDAPFATHVDAPYYDRSRQHVSRRTLLLYLTPGRGDEPVLRFEGGPEVRAIAPLQAFVFDQRLAHAGRPYDDGPKVFLRSELVFSDRDLRHAPEVGELFARACYLGRESVFAPELAAHAERAHDRAAAAHWGGPRDAPAERPWIHREFRGAHFVTDGHAYWFRRDAQTLVECAALALLDLLGAQVDGQPFARLCRSRALTRGDGPGWIAAYLRELPAAPEPALARLDKQALFPPPEPPESGMGMPGSPDFDADPFPDDWDATRQPRVLEALDQARRWARQRIFAAPILMLGKEVFLDPARFVVEADRIHVLSRERLGPVHFAGARFFGPEDFVGVDVTLDTLQPLVPPMFFREGDETVELRCDLFRNTWMVDVLRERVPVPRVVDRPEAEPDDAAWLRAAGLTRDRLRAQLGK